MSAPHYQIAGLRVPDAPKAFHPIVEIARVRIGIRKACSFVNGMNQVGTVVAGISTYFGIERGRDDCSSFV